MAWRDKRLWLGLGVIFGVPLALVLAKKGLGRVSLNPEIARDCQAPKAEIERAIKLVEENVEVIDNIYQMQMKRKAFGEVLPKVVDFGNKVIARLEEVTPHCEAVAPIVYPRSLCEDVKEIVRWAKENLEKCWRSAEECYEEQKREFERKSWWEGLSRETKESTLKQAKEDCERTQRWHCVYVADGITNEIHSHEAMPLLLCKGNEARGKESYSPDIYLMWAYKDLYNKNPEEARKSIAKAKKALEEAEEIKSWQERKTYVCKRG